MKQRNFYCVLQPDGAFCHWSLAETRTLSWQAFLRGLGHPLYDRRKLAQYKREGFRCVKVKLAQEGGGE